MENIGFKVNLNERYTSKWLVYSLHDDSGAMLYIGVSSVTGVFAFSDVKKHPMFANFFPNGVNVNLWIHRLFESKRDAHMWKFQYLKEKPRPRIMQYYGASGGKIAVKCLETNEVFSSITECAKAHGICPSNLSKSLKGEPNYRTVGGRRYEHAKYYKSDQTWRYVPY